MADALTNETAWWQPRLGKKLKDLSIPRLISAGIAACRCMSSKMDW